MSEGVGGDGGHDSQDSVDLLVPHLQVLVDILSLKGRVGFLVEGGEGAHGGDHLSHRVGLRVNVIINNKNYYLHRSGRTSSSN